MRKKNLVFVVTLLVLATAWAVHQAPRKDTTADVPKKVASFEAITYGPACSPEGDAITFYGDGRIELPDGVVQQARLTAEQVATLTAAVNEAGYFNVEELSADEMLGKVDTADASKAQDPRAGCFFRVRDAMNPDRPHKRGIPVSTAPSTFTSVMAGGKARQIRYYDGIHYEGCPAPAAKVANFETTVSGMMKTLHLPRIGKKNCF